MAQDVLVLKMHFQTRPISALETRAACQICVFIQHFRLFPLLIHMTFYICSLTVKHEETLLACSPEAGLGFVSDVESLWPGSSSSESVRVVVSSCQPKINALHNYHTNCSLTCCVSIRLFTCKFEILHKKEMLDGKVHKF